MWRWRAQRSNAEATLRANEIAVLARPMPRGAKRLIVLTHSYLGVAFAVLSVMWFASGIVLACNPFPALYEAERLRLAPLFDCTTCRVTEAEARTLVGSSGNDAVESARLGMLGSRPVWRIMNDRGRWRAIFADSLTIVLRFDPSASPATRKTTARHPTDMARDRGPGNQRWILDRRPLWDVLVVGLSLGGLIASLSGAILAWRWVRDFRRSAPRFRKR